MQEELFMKFAEFEEKVKEVDRARAIYRYALDHIPKAQVHGAQETGPKLWLVSQRLTANLDQSCGLGARRLTANLLVMTHGAERLGCPCMLILAEWPYLNTQISPTFSFHDGEQATAVYARAVAFEKQHGDRAGIEDVIVGERRFQYEEEVFSKCQNLSL